MRKIVLTGLALLLTGGADAMAAGPAPPATAPSDSLPLPVGEVARAALEAGAAQPGLDVRVWLEDERDLFRDGDATRILLRPSEDAYVAVLHVDTHGNVEMLFPSSPYEDGLLRGGRIYSVAFGRSTTWNVRGSPGMGYIYAMASPEPLDFRSVRGLWNRRAGWSDDRVVVGDPFGALDEIVSILLDGAWGYHAEDWYTYHLGRRYTYPRYACYDGYGSWYGSRGYDYGDCDRVRILLRTDPHYYDTRYHSERRRRGYYAERRAPRGVPSHGYKERVDGRDRVQEPTRLRPGGRTDRDPPQVRGGRDAPPPRAREPEERRPAPTRERPTLERRRPESTPRANPQPRETPRRIEPARREEPARESDPGGARTGGSSGRVERSTGRPTGGV